MPPWHFDVIETSVSRSARISSYVTPAASEDSIRATATGVIPSESDEVEGISSKDELMTLHGFVYYYHPAVQK